MVGIQLTKTRFIMHITPEMTHAFKHFLFMVIPVSIFLYFSNFDNLSMALAIGLTTGIVLEASKKTIWQEKNIEKNYHWLRWRTNYSLGLIMGVLSFPLNYLMFNLVDSLHIGLFNWIELPGLLQIIIIFLAIDLERYWYHYIQHKITLLWRMHRVHHSDTSFDFTLFMKAFPVMPVLSIIPQSAVLILLGATVWQFLFFMLFAQSSFLFVHSNIKLPDCLDNFLKLFLITPSVHYIHHSSAWKDT